MRRHLSLLWLLWLFAGSSIKAAPGDNTKLRYIITTQPSQYSFLDFPVKAERLFRRQTVGLTVSYRPATSRGGPVSDYPFAAYMDRNMQNGLYNAFTLGLSSKYFLGNRSRLFVEGELFYRHWWFTNKECSFNLANAYRFSGTRAERQEVLGTKIVFGTTLVRSSRNQTKIIVEPFIGIGFRVKMYHFETRNGTVKDRYYDHLVEEGSWIKGATDIGALQLFTPQFGVRVGMGL